MKASHSNHFRQCRGFLTHSRRLGMKPSVSELIFDEGFPVSGQDLTMRRATRSEAYSDEFLRDAGFGHLRVLRWVLDNCNPMLWRHVTAN